MSFVQRATEMLFPEHGTWAKNIKFFAATDAGITAEELAHQIVIAEEQVQAGLAVPVRLDI